MAEKNDSLRLPAFGASALNYLSWREQTKTFDQLGAVQFGTFTLERHWRSRKLHGLRHYPVAGAAAWSETAGGTDVRRGGRQAWGGAGRDLSRRTKELGVRMALGADRRRVVRLVVGEGMIIGIVGIAIGIVVAAASGRVLSALVFGVSIWEPFTYAGSRHSSPSSLWHLASCLQSERRGLIR